MTQNIQEVFVNCPNYDEIVNVGYAKDDYITEQLIENYREKIFLEHTQEELSQLKQLDQVLYEYISSKPFYDYVQNYYLKDQTTSFQDIMHIIDIYHNYKSDTFKDIKNTKWI